MSESLYYRQWKALNRVPGESSSQSIERFSKQYGLDAQRKRKLLDDNPDTPAQESLEKETGFLSQTLGAGADEAQKSFYSALAGPGSQIVRDIGWDSGADFLQDVGEEGIAQQEEDLKAYGAPQTREELIQEGGLLGKFYEHIAPEELYTPEQLGRQFLPSVMTAGGAQIRETLAPVVQ